MSLTPCKFVIGTIWHFTIVLHVLPLSVQGIDYESRPVTPPLESAKIFTTQTMLARLNDKQITQKTQYTLQEATEYLLQYGALLRTQILDTFGPLVYEYYDDFGINELDSLYKVYRATLERQYNVFDILPSILADPDIRPSKICTHINAFVDTCLKDSSEKCKRIMKHDQPHPETLGKPALNATVFIYRNANILQNYPNGFSLKVILDYLRNGKLAFTPALFSGLLHNIRYDDFDDKVRESEKELLIYLSALGERENVNQHLLPSKEIKSRYFRNVGSLLKYYLETRASKFPQKIKGDARYLANHLIAEIDAVNENIQSLGHIYENGTFHLEYLFDLVLPIDLIDKDVIQARDYLLKLLASTNIVEESLKIEKYQQGSPDQLLLQMVGQLREIGFLPDIATSLKSHANFWHRSRMIVNLNDLLDLFDSYENLRQVSKYDSFMDTIDLIKDNLWDSKNVSIELLCETPRSCLARGLQLILDCAHINDETKSFVEEFFTTVTPKGHLIENECPKREECPTVQTELLMPMVKSTVIPTKEKYFPPPTIPMLESVENSAKESVDESIDDKPKTKNNPSPPKITKAKGSDQEFEDSKNLSIDDTSKHVSEEVLKSVPDQLKPTNATFEQTMFVPSNTVGFEATTKPTTNSMELSNETPMVPDIVDQSITEPSISNQETETPVTEPILPVTQEPDNSCDLCGETGDCSIQCSTSKQDQSTNCENMSDDCLNSSDCSKEMSDCLSSMTKEELEPTTVAPCVGPDCGIETIDRSVECLGENCFKSTDVNDVSSTDKPPKSVEVINVNSNVNIDLTTPSDVIDLDIEPTTPLVDTSLEKIESQAVINSSDILCANHDPHHRSKLRRLENIKKITALKANMLSRFEAQDKRENLDTSPNKLRKRRPVRRVIEQDNDEYRMRILPHRTW